MHFMMIVSKQRRHKMASLLIVLEIAVTCAIVCNAVFLIRDRLARMDRASGVPESELVRISLTGIGTKADENALTEQDLAALRAIPGVKLAAATNMVPFGGSSWNTSASTIVDDPSPPINAAMYMGSKDLVETLGVQLIAGRNFLPEEFAAFKDVRERKAPLVSLIISRGMA